VLARGLAAGDADTYQLQRLRWGTGAMQVLRRENPMWVPGLTIGQRLSYAATLLGWFDAWRMLGFATLPMVVIATGVVPIRAEFSTFLVAFLVTFALQQTALKALSRGCHRPILSVVFELVRMTSNLRATLTLVTRRRPTFVVTPKGRQGDGRRRVRVPLPLRALLVGSVLSTAWFALTLMGRTPVQYEELGAVIAALGWLLFNAVLVILAIDRVRALRYAPERRATVRFETVLQATVDGFAGEVRDASTTGVRVVTCATAGAGDVVNLVLHVDDRIVMLKAVVRSVRRDENGWAVQGLEFEPGQHEARATLVLSLFRRASTTHVDRDPHSASAPALVPIPA